MAIDLVRILLDYLSGKEIDVEKILTELVYALYNRYCEYKDISALVAAKDFIKVYEQMGLPGTCQDDMFEVIKKEYEQYSVVRASSQKMPDKTIPVNKTQIRRLIGRWNSKVQSMPIESVLEDILEKAKSEAGGLYTYWTEHKMGKEIKRFEYKLLVSKDEILFWDCYQDRVYRLEYRGIKNEDSSC